MKKVLFLIPNLGGGGAERVLVNLVNNLDKAKYDVTVRTLFKSNVNAKYLKKDVKYIEGKVKQFRGNIHILKLFSPKFLYKFFIKERYDIVVSYLEGPTARIVSGCPDGKTKKVSWIHVEQDGEKALAHSFRSITEAKKCYMSYDATICVANSVKENFLSLVDVDNCIVLYNTNETDKILKLADELIEESISNEVNVFSVGRLTHQKGYDRLINVHKKLIDEGIRHHIYILGTGDQEDMLSQRIKEYNLGDTFHLLGFSDNPYKYVKAADMFICSSRREGFSTAVTESLIVGTPVISTCCSGAYELLGYNNEYGIVTENSEDGIYEGLKHMLINKKLRDEYAIQAAIRGQKFSTEKTVAAVEEMFEEL